MMPKLSNKAHRLERLGDLQPAHQPNNQEENFLALAQNGTRKRRRGKGNTAAIAKMPSEVKPMRPTIAGRGRGIRSIVLDLELPCEVLPYIAFNRREGIAGKKIAMDAGASVDKIEGVEEEASTAFRWKGASGQHIEYDRRPDIFRFVELTSALDEAVDYTLINSICKGTIR
ncbi:casein kinase 1 HD16 [Olea europaea subsp. europaea]|uniref:Casein kinase 1 HD16 n=1 Tax=Olea europaea subsp. europaea TaxID=158383 RepID=A0A8S0S3T5_OLEEU|nr:casein kinase 1 HD16 [Olea europaea subsp. europaea]